MAMLGSIYKFMHVPTGVGLSVCIYTSFVPVRPNMFNDRFTCTKFDLHVPLHV